MKILLIYHKSPYGPVARGGELSVRTIVEYLRGNGHELDLLPFHVVDQDETRVKNYDLVLSWGRGAEPAWKACAMFRVPFALMVRWWRNVCPLPAGDLMHREIDKNFASRYSHIFRTAATIITNTEYSAAVIARWQPSAATKTVVSYVPIPGDLEPTGGRDGALLIVTPEIYGEEWLVSNLAGDMPGERFLVVNCRDESQRQMFEAMGENVTALLYADMAEIWPRTKALLLPIYHNDICGTRRVTPEAWRHALPVIATDRCGVREKIPGYMLVSRDAAISEWIQKIKWVNSNYTQYREFARDAWLRYDTPAELEKFEKTLLECVKKA